MKQRRDAKATRNRILMTAVNIIREQGYEATTVDDICARAEVTKGAFFHHFKSKTAMAIAAAQFFGEFADQLFEKAEYQKIQDPLDRILAYIDFRESLLQGDVPSYTCLLGTIVQEVHQTHSDLRVTCQEQIWGHAQTLVPTIQAALDSRGINNQDALDIALFTQATLQGGFILAKAAQSPDPARAAIAHLRRYIQCIFAFNGEPTSAKGPNHEPKH